MAVEEGGTIGDDATIYKEHGNERREGKDGGKERMEGRKGVRGEARSGPSPRCRCGGGDRV